MDKNTIERAKLIKQLRLSATYALRNGFISDAARLQRAASQEEIALLNDRIKRLETAISANSAT